MSRLSARAIVSTLITLAAGSIVADAVSGIHGWTAPIVLVALMTLGGMTLWLLERFTWYAIGWIFISVRDEAVPDERMFELVGDPYWHPTGRVVCQARLENTLDFATVIINPKWMNLVHTSANLNRQDVSDETSILGKAYSNVSVGTEPPSMVCIKNPTGRVIGFGARVKMAGEDVLLTAYHSWCGDHTPAFLAKAGKEVDAHPISWECVSGSNHKMLDFVCVRVPKQVWAALGVKQCKIASASPQQVVTVYGGSSSAKLQSGVGVVNSSEWEIKLIHTAPTSYGWSGTPLYSRHGIVGMHLGFEEIGTANRAVNLSYLSRMLETTETLPPMLNFTRIDIEDVETRSYEFLTAEIFNLGEVKIGKREFAYVQPKFKSKAWADYDTDEEMDYEEAFFNATSETAWFVEPEHLNCQGAVSGKPLPPSFQLQVMTGSIPSECSKKESESPLLADRIVSLERCLENVLVMLSLMQQNTSQSSQVSDGPKEDQKLNLTPCYSKQESSVLPLPPALLEMPAKDCARSTPEVESNPASKVQTGQSKRSSKRSRKQRRRAKSTKAPAPASPSTSSAQPTRKC